MLKRDRLQVTSRLHLRTAIHQAVLAAARGALRTKTVHSEILFMLNPTNNVSILSSHPQTLREARGDLVYDVIASGHIEGRTKHKSRKLTVAAPTQISEAIRRYGVSDGSTSLLVVRICAPQVGEEQARAAAGAVVQGEKRPVDELPNVVDWAAVKKVSGVRFGFMR